MKQALKSGTTLRGGSYRIERTLGQGGFGITYLAVDLNLDRKVAIKEFFPKDYCDRDESTSHVTLGTESVSEFVGKLKAKFLKEARNIAKFDHPGIIKIHAAFEENNTAYYVMDFIEGESLSEKVRNNGPLSEKQALSYIERVGAALTYVHSHRINHLDVKPANIMIRCSDDLPVLIDFGLSKQYDSAGMQTSTTPTGISHGFAPMEQYIEGGVKEFSPQTDVYSLAATLYFVLTGIVPPQAPQLVDEELSFPISIPEDLFSSIAKAMCSSRRNRHETIAEFMVDIKNDFNKEITLIQTPDSVQVQVKGQNQIPAHAYEAHSSPSLKIKPTLVKSVDNPVKPASPAILEIIPEQQRQYNLSNGIWYVLGVIVIIIGIIYAIKILQYYGLIPIILD